MNLIIAPVSILLYFNLYFTCGQQFWNTGCPWVMIGTKISTAHGLKTQYHMTASLSNSSPGSSSCHCSWKTAWIIKWVLHTTSYKRQKNQSCVSESEAENQNSTSEQKCIPQMKLGNINQELKLTLCSLFITWTLDFDSMMVKYFLSIFIR